eukprot:TRINITY_DN2867_c0_g1_i1.p1 TRINITY_DN2867_c0_g1~~TRINITY_DN2867_c0_g1_i1.p1  ORF type:complete len:204 (-),score=40.42 TRINITY_DN2867_c0_g1_i1:166-753(-)
MADRSRSPQARRSPPRRSSRSPPRAAETGATGGKKLFIGGLSWSTTDESLRRAFEQYGSVTEARVATDRESGRSRGFGFVTFVNDADGNTAISRLDGQDLDGRQIRVSESTGAGGGGGRGGGRGGRDGGYGGRGGGRDGGYGGSRDSGRDRGYGGGSYGGSRDAGYGGRDSGYSGSRDSGRDSRGYSGGYDAPRY